MKEHVENEVLRNKKLKIQFFLWVIPYKFSHIWLRSTGEAVFGNVLSAYDFYGKFLRYRMCSILLMITVCQTNELKTVNVGSQKRKKIIAKLEEKGLRHASSAWNRHSSCTLCVCRIRTVWIHIIHNRCECKNAFFFHKILILKKYNIFLVVIH